MAKSFAKQTAEQLLIFLVKMTDGNDVKLRILHKQYVHMSIRSPNYEYWKSDKYNLRFGMINDFNVFKFNINQLIRGLIEFCKNTKIRGKQNFTAETGGVFLYADPDEAFILFSPCVPS